MNFHRLSDRFHNHGYVLPCVTGQIYRFAKLNLHSARPGFLRLFVEQVMGIDNSYRNQGHLGFDSQQERTTLEGAKVWAVGSGALRENGNGKTIPYPLPSYSHRLNAALGVRAIDEHGG